MLVPRVFRSHIERYPNIIFKIWTPKPDFSSVQSNCPVVSDSEIPCRLQHTRPPWQSPTPELHSKLMSIESVIPLQLML